MKAHKIEKPCASCGTTMQVWSDLYLGCPKVAAYCSEQCAIGGK